MHVHASTAAGSKSCLHPKTSVPLISHVVRFVRFVHFVRFVLRSTSIPLTSHVVRFHL